MNTHTQLPDLSHRLGQALAARGLTLSTAESCTGGLIASILTDQAGSSQYFQGSMVAYSNEIKEWRLGVPQGALAAFGAVSAPVALHMARRATQYFGTDLALSATGIAGPDGGTPTKPVGLVYVALYAPHRWSCRRLLLPYDRLGNKAATTCAALKLALSWCDGARH